MADETWSAKVSLELKEELGQFVKESGLSSKEFLEQLLLEHKVALLQGTDAQRSTDIQQLSYHLDKIKASFIGLVEKGIDVEANFTEVRAQESTLHKSIVDQQQYQIKQAQEERDQAVLEKADMSILLADITARKEEIETENRTKQSLIQMQQEKITELGNQAEVIQALKDQVENLNQAAALQTKRIADLEHEALGTKRELEQAQAALEAQKKDAAKDLAQQAQVHGLELQKATMDLREKLQAENHELMKEHYAKLEALTNKNQELNEKLLHQKELEATPKPTKAKTKATPGQG